MQSPPNAPFPTTAAAPVPTIRIARPARALAPLIAFYTAALDFALLSTFSAHAGFSGAMLGYPGAGWHLEFTVRDGDGGGFGGGGGGVEAGGAEGAAPQRDEDDLLVLYLPSAARWEAAVARAEAHGCAAVASANPYWDAGGQGRTYVDPEGGRVVLWNGGWEL